MGKSFHNALQQAQLTFKLYGYQFGSAKRYIKATKTYLADNGIILSLNAGGYEIDLIFEVNNTVYVTEYHRE